MPQIPARVEQPEDVPCCAHGNSGHSKCWWPARRVTPRDVWLLAEVAVLLGKLYVVAVSTCETLPRDSPEHLGGNLWGTGSAAYSSGES